MTVAIGYELLTSARQSLPVRIAPGMDAGQAAKEFEGVYLATMLKSMFTDLEQGGLDDGQAQATWRGLLVEEYAKSIADAGGVGIADIVKNELIAIQEAAE